MTKAILGLVMVLALLIVGCSNGYKVNLQDKCPDIAEQLKLSPNCKENCLSNINDQCEKLCCYGAMNLEEQCQNACALHCSSINMKFDSIDRPNGVCYCSCK